LPASTHDDKSQSQNFWRDFRDVFTPQARRRARFKVRVKNEDCSQDYIDVFWPGMLVEQECKGHNLDDATRHALDYLSNLPAHELPRHLLVSNFAGFYLRDLYSSERHNFALAELLECLHLFSFLTGYHPIGQQRPEDPSSPATSTAVYTRPAARPAPGSDG
jgi:hypothetical protein